MLSRRCFSSSFALPLVDAGAASPLFSALDVARKNLKLSDFKGKRVGLEWRNSGCPFVRKHHSGNMRLVNPQGMLVYAGGIDSNASGPVGDIKTATNYVRQGLSDAPGSKAISVASNGAYGRSVKYKA